MRWLARILLALGVLFCLSAFLPADIGNLQLLWPFAPQSASSSGASRLVFLMPRRVRDLRAVVASPDAAADAVVRERRGRAVRGGTAQGRLRRSLLRLLRDGAALAVKHGTGPRGPDCHRTRRAHRLYLREFALYLGAARSKKPSLTTVGQFA